MIMKKLTVFLALLIGSVSFSALSQSKALQAGYKAIKGLRTSQSQIGGARPITGHPVGPIRGFNQGITFENHRIDSLGKKMRSHTDSLINDIRESTEKISEAIKPLLATNKLFDAVEARQAELKYAEGNDSIAQQWLAQYFELACAHPAAGYDRDRYRRLVDDAVDNYLELRQPTPGELMIDIYQFHADNPDKKYDRRFGPCESRLINKALAMSCDQAISGNITEQEINNIRRLEKYARKYRMLYDRYIVDALCYYLAGDTYNTRMALEKSEVALNEAAGWNNEDDKKRRRLLDQMPEIEAGNRLMDAVLYSFPTEIIIVDDPDELQSEND